MKKTKIFIACDTTNLVKVKKIINQSKTNKIKIGYKFGLEFMNSKNGRTFLAKLRKKIKQYKKIYSLEDVKLSFTKDALKSIATKAILRKTGARGLRSILEEILLESMYEIPSEENINEVVINRDVVTGKGKPIVAYSKKKAEIGSSA